MLIWILPWRKNVKLLCYWQEIEFHQWCRGKRVKVNKIKVLQRGDRAKKGKNDKAEHRRARNWTCNWVIILLQRRSAGTSFRINRLQPLYVYTRTISLSLIAFSGFYRESSLKMYIHVFCMHTYVLCNTLL
jgi:hypothetical protein